MPEGETLIAPALTALLPLSSPAGAGRLVPAPKRVPMAPWQRKAELEEQERVAKEALKEIEYNEDVSEVIAKTVDEHVAALEEEMRKRFEEREQELLKKIAELQARAGG